MIDKIEAPGSAAKLNHVDVSYWFKELMICYKFGEKLRYRKALDILKPYLDTRLCLFFEDIYLESCWTNPITGRKVK